MDGLLHFSPRSNTEKNEAHHGNIQLHTLVHRPADDHASDGAARRAHVAHPAARGFNGAWALLAGAGGRPAGAQVRLLPEVAGRPRAAHTHIERRARGGIVLLPLALVLDLGTLVAGVTQPSAVVGAWMWSGLHCISQRLTLRRSWSTGTSGHQAGTGLRSADSLAGSA